MAIIVGITVGFWLSGHTPHRFMRMGTAFTVTITLAITRWCMAPQGCCLLANGITATTGTMATMAITAGSEP